MGYDSKGRVTEVETRLLNQQVKRNISRFPERYMFQLTKDEYDRLRSQNVTLKRGQQVKYLHYAFTEHDNQIMVIFEYLKQLEAARQKELDQKNRKRIGFRTPGNQED